jgi:Uma2 family endonuclease
VAWVSRKNYVRGRPEAQDVLLVIEVAATSLAFDRNTNGPLYAKTGIADYWIVNVRNRCVEVYREPVRGRYTDRQTYRDDETVSPLAFPKVSLTVNCLFP